MRLRNKKTGQLGNFIINKDHFECVDLEYVPGYRNLAELNAEWEDVPEEPKDFWFIDDEGGVECGVIEFEKNLNLMQAIGNYFETKEEAEKAVEKLKAFKRLKDKGFRFEGYDRNYDHWHINFTFDNCCTGEPHSASDDLYLLFGGEE